MTKYNFTIGARLDSKANKEGQRRIQVTYTYQRKTTEYKTELATDPALWDKSQQQLLVHSAEAAAANAKIQQIQRLLFQVASSIAEPDHELVRSGYNLAYATHEAEAAVDKQTQQQQQLLVAATDTDSLLDVFTTVHNTQDMLRYQMQSVKESIAEIDLYTARSKKSKLIQRLENKGIYKSDKKLQEEQKYFVDMQTEYVNDMIQTDQIRPSTLRQMKSLFNNLNKFSQDKNYALTFDKMNLDFYKAYGDWVLKEQKNFDGYFGSLIKRLKTWLGWCLDEHNIQVNTQFRSKKFKAPREEKDVIYLKLNELEWMDEFRNHPTCKPSWIRVIDMALVQSSIGCRYSDMVNASWYYADDFLKGFTSKNSSKYIIPLKSSKWLMILKDYNMSFKMPVYNRPDAEHKVLSEQKFNKYIKLILQQMYLTKNLHIEKNERIATKNTRRTIPVIGYEFKYNLISTHSFRRSFVSRMVRLGYNVDEVALMIGTKSIEELRKYFQLEEEDLKLKADKIHK